MVNFSAQILGAADRFPDRTAIEVVRTAGLETRSYRDLALEAGQFAAWLAGQAVAPGDRAAILADNSADWIAAYLGTLWIGAVAVPLDTAYKAGQVRTVLESSGAKLLFTTPRYLTTAQAAVDALAGNRPAIVLIEGTAEGFADRNVIRVSGPPPSIHDFGEPGTRHREPSTEKPAPHFAGSPAAVMLYTSGTTADPKGVVLTHANLEAEREAALAVVDASELDTVLGVLPLFHALAQMANLLVPLAIGARVVFLETVSSTTLLEALGARGITIFACVPQFFYLIHQRVLAEVARHGALRARVFRALVHLNVWLRDRWRWNPGRRWFRRVHLRLGPSMRILLTGGSRFDPVIAKDLYGLGFTILNAYGLTETSGGATVQRPNDRFTTSVGQPLPGVEAAIAPRAADSEAADDGEILIRGPIVMREYFGRPDATREALDADGWLHTGDLGRIDSEGRVYVTGRKKEIIVLSSGKNLYPEEIEAHYRQSAFIRELCIMGLARPGEPAAERLHAVVVPDDDALRARGTVNVGDLIRFEIESASASLPAHKRILSYDLVREPLPRTTTGKLKRHEIERAARERAARAAAPIDRPLNDDERAWLGGPGRADLLKAIAARLGKPTVPPEANLELDLGLDSMERVELLTMLERRAGTSVAAETRARIFSVRQLVEAVLAAPAASSAAVADQASEPPWRSILAEAPAPELAAELRKPKRLVAAVFYLVLRVLALVSRLFVRVRVSGRSNLPAAGPFLICPNHQTFFDAFFLCAALPYRTLRQLFFVGAAEFFETRARQRFARLINLVPVDPDAHLVQAMQAGAAGLRLGKVLILFPEGEREIDGQLKRFRKGAAILAGELDVPIVPVALDGLFPLWPRGRPIQWKALRPWRSREVSVVFGAPLRVPAGAPAEGTSALATAVSGLLEAGKPHGKAADRGANVT